MVNGLDLPGELLGRQPQEDSDRRILPNRDPLRLGRGLGRAALTPRIRLTCRACPDITGIRLGDDRLAGHLSLELDALGFRRLLDVEQAVGAPIADAALLLPGELHLRRQLILFDRALLLHGLGAPREDSFIGALLDPFAGGGLERLVEIGHRRHP